MQQYVITLHGKDRPGIITQFANLIQEHHGNWLDANISQLKGKIAGLIVADISKQHQNDFESAIKSYQVDELDFSVEALNEQNNQPEQQKMNLKLISNDRPGIVKEITTHLNQFDVTLSKLQSHRYPAPMSGGELFSLEAQLLIPSSISKEKLATDLETIADELLVEINLSSDD